MSQQNNILTIIVKSPEAVVFEGEAKSLTSFNKNGLFDVLPYHENFISLIEKQLIIVQTNNQKKELTIESGVMHVKENQIEIYLGVQTIL
ncbi:MAG TPA: hypothetical protein VFQ63_00055 [Patescibacteria group bacterium]|nr:hypothetical protein [Patescibacteria group bacterium]